MGERCLPKIITCPINRKLAEPKNKSLQPLLLQPLSCFQFLLATPAATNHAAMESAQLAQSPGDSVVQLEPSGKSSAAQSLHTDNAVRPVQIPITEVACDNDMWFSLPPEVSSAVLYGLRSEYTWDNNSYKIDFDVMEQTNSQRTFIEGKRTTERF